MLVAIGSVLMGLGAGTARAITDDDVVKAIEKGQQWLIGRQGGDGAWPEKNWHETNKQIGHTEIALFTLVYTGVSVNHDAITKGVQATLNRGELGYTYATSMRCMALAHLQKKLLGEKRDAIRKALQADALWLCNAQGKHGDWNYTTLGGAGPYDPNTASSGRYDPNAAVSGRL